MEERPPVPPKDAKYTARMEVERPSTAPSSGSKRKRDAHDDARYDLRNGNLEPVDPNDHTPKRSRSSTRHGDTSASEDNGSTQPRLVRRKKGSRNLSNLNLRHAAQKQASPPAQPRGSKFQEGSLTDKPSEKPPSVFTRMTRTDSGNIQFVDQLMENYHDGVPTPGDPVEAAIEREKALIPQRVATMSAENAKKDDGNKGFFQFGRQWAANFHPIALWNKLWNESKEELRREDQEEAMRKQQLKQAAEERYAQMKKAGQLPLKPVGNFAGAGGSEDDVGTPRDSGIEIDSLKTSFEHKRSASGASQLMLSKDETSNNVDNDAVDAPGKPTKGFKSRLHLKTPSLSNIKKDLKRVGSDFNLGAAATMGRQSSSSISPVKTDFDNSTLKKSASRYDLKKQNKLSKRVSDLETKLQQARKELDDALVEASPMPKLGSRYERFTPVSTMKRPKFMPGKLPTLPSERILMAEQMDLDVNDDDAVNGARENENEPRKGLHLSLKEFLAEREQDESEQETLKARGRKQYPPHAADIFKHNNDNINGQSHINNKDPGINKTVTETAKHTSEEVENMDPNSITNGTTNGTAEPMKPANYASLDAKLKALEANVKTARNANKPKKRKSAAKDNDKAFRPGSESDDDAEWVEATPKKKRKSTSDKAENSPPNKRTSRATTHGSKTSPKDKKGKEVKTNGEQYTVHAKNAVIQNEGLQVSEETEEAQSGAEQYSADELADDQATVRTSMDSQGRPLDTLLEVEEETTTTTVPLKTEPSKPTAKATPARYGRNTLRARSSSPNKRNGSVQPGSEEQIMTRAAVAAQQHPGRKAARSVSPPPTHSKTTTVIEESVTVVPGQGDVPKLPKGATGSFESLIEVEGEDEGTDVEMLQNKPNEEFEWPEDVF